ncbi:MAG: hypothetical protein COB38_04625 [Gammaproteobacteria bacterium]|nr:MAG: hypothetical protein COB38_04625 [Gammaproteobacteria bacterium]
MRVYNTACHHFSKCSVIYCLTLSLLISAPGQSEEGSAVKETQALNENSSEPSNTNSSNFNPLTLSYFIDNQSLIEDVKYDSRVNQSKIETLSDGELLILKHNAKNRKKRGHVLFLHTNGESANHRRIVRPLSIQLSQLGWNVFIPNIAKEDFTKPKFGTKRKIIETSTQSIDSSVQNLNEEKTASNESVSDETNKELAKEKPSNSNSDDSTTEKEATKSKLQKISHYFDSTEKYQDYVKEVCDKIFADPEWMKQPRILILNQSSSYWGLSCLENIRMPTVLLDPQLPFGVKNDLADIFSKQSSSFYVFYSQLTANTKMASFSKALSSNQWRSKNQRYSQGILPRGNLNLEDTGLAKRITGWAEKLRKNKN